MKQKTLNTALILAIALTLASKKLQRHKGVHASDWQKKLLEQDVSRFNRSTPYQLQKFIANNFNLDSLMYAFWLIFR